MNDARLICEAARDLGITETNLEKWFVRGYVPHKWRLPIVQKLAERGVTINVTLFDEFPRIAA